MDEDASGPQAEQTGRPVSRQPAGRTAPAKRTGPVKVVAKQATPKKAAAARKAAPAKKAVPVKAVPEKAGPVKPAQVKAVPEKAVPGKRVPVKAAPRKSAAKKAAAKVVSPSPETSAPVEVAPAAEVSPPVQVAVADPPDENSSTCFDEASVSYARDRFSAVLGPQILRDEPWPYPKTLQIGAATGFFSLNLRRAGVLEEVHVSDASAAAVRTAQSDAVALGFEVQGEVAGVEALPYPDGTFDLVLGYAVIHRTPDVEAALAEVLRVLKPGGRFVFAGEPSTVGDWYTRRLGQVTEKVTTAVTRWPALRGKWARSPTEGDASSPTVAWEVIADRQTFDPEQLRAMAERAGAHQVRTQSEELLTAVLGRPMFTHRSWQRLSALDRVLARALPASIFYNLGVTGIKPAGG